MGAISPWHVLIAVGLLVILFTRRNAISSLLSEAGKSIAAFRDGLRRPDVREIAHKTTQAAANAEKQNE